MAPAGAVPAKSSAAVPASSAPETLVFQRDRDHEGHGVSLRPIAEEHYQETWKSEYSSTRLSRSLVQLMVSFDRLLSDEKRCNAYTHGVDAALAKGARTFAVLGVGSLLPALHAARRGASVAIVEACEPLAQIARRAASDNGLEHRLAVVGTCEKLWSAWGREPPDAILSERIDEGLLAEGLVPQLRAAVGALGGKPPAHLLPSGASLTAVCIQLGFEGVDGFGLDGLGADLRHFDALRPHGEGAAQLPGYWPVRLQHARQPHKRLSAEFHAGTLDFAQLCTGGGVAGGGGGAGGGGVGGVGGLGGVGGSVNGAATDLSPLPLSTPPRSPDVSDGAAAWATASDAAATAQVAAAAALLGAPAHTVRLVATEDGLLNAICFWFDLSVYGSSASARVSSGPPDSGARGAAPGAWSEGWRQAACYLASPQYVRRGEVMTIGVAITASQVRFHLLGVHAPPSDGGKGGEDGAVDVSDAAAHAVGGGAAPRTPVSAPTSLPKSLHPMAAVPINAYHFCMVADTVRNTSFRTAIERAVARRPGCRVLDIGAGTGLLGLIASRAGASRVDCVEMSDVLHVTARRTLEASGVNPSSSAVWHTISTELPIDPSGVNGPPGQADLIVSEILDSGLIGEGVLHTMRDAASRLLAPGGQLLPRGATVYAMAVELRPPEVGDFDLRALEQLRRGCFYSSMRLHTLGHVKLSSAVAAFEFDFASPGPLEPDGVTPSDREVRLSLPITKRGTCNAILWWFDLHLDDELTLPAGPGASVRTWKQNVAHVEPGIKVKKGDVIEALVWTQRDDQIHVAGGKPGVKRPTTLGSSNRLEPSFMLRDVSTWAQKK